jgi:hypothetical protein
MNWENKKNDSSGSYIAKRGIIAVVIFNRWQILHYPSTS